MNAEPNKTLQATAVSAMPLILACPQRLNLFVGLCNVCAAFQFVQSLSERVLLFGPGPLDQALAPSVTESPSSTAPGSGNVCAFSSASAIFGGMRFRHGGNHSIRWFS